MTGREIPGELLPELEAPGLPGAWRRLLGGLRAAPSWLLRLFDLVNGSAAASAKTRLGWYAADLATVQRMADT